MLVRGTICDADGGPIDGATLDVWQTSADGLYDVQDERQTPMNLRGLFRTAEDGRFWFRTTKPASYPIPTDGPVGEILVAMGRSEMRPAHIHFIVGAPGHESVTTHRFVEGDPYLESDAVFGVKETLIASFAQCNDPSQAADLRVGNPFYLLDGTWYSRAQAMRARSFSPRGPDRLSTPRARDHHGGTSLAGERFVRPSWTCCMISTPGAPRHTAHRRPNEVSFPNERNR